jgi:hypothetical protein
MGFNDITWIALPIKEFVTALKDRSKLVYIAHPLVKLWTCRLSVIASLSSCFRSNGRLVSISKLFPDGGSFCATPEVSGYSRQALAFNTSLLLLLLQKFKNVNPHISSGLAPIRFISLQLLPFYFFLSGNRELNLPFTRRKKAKKRVRSENTVKWKKLSNGTVAYMHSGCNPVAENRWCDVLKKLSLQKASIMPSNGFISPSATRHRCQR